MSFTKPDSISLEPPFQPDQLPSRRDRVRYVVVSRIFFGIALGLCGTMVFGLVWEGWLDFGQSWGWILLPLIFGFVGGVSLAVVDWGRIATASGWQLSPRAPALGILIHAILTAGAGVFVGMAVMALLAWATVGMFTVGLLPGAAIGVMAGAVIGIFMGTRQSVFAADVRWAEELRWSWGRVPKGALVGAFYGLLFFLFTTLSLGPGLARWSEYAYACLIGGLIGSLFTGLRAGQATPVSTSSLFVGLSVRNALIGGLAVGLPTALLTTTMHGIYQWITFDRGVNWAAGVNFGFLLGMAFGFVAAFWFGGLDLLHYYVLRLIQRLATRTRSEE